MAQAVQANQVNTVSDSRVKSFIAQTYLLMSIGLLVTAVVSTWVSTNVELLWKVSTNPWIAFGLFMIQIVIVVALSAKIMDLSTGAAALLFFLYAALTGVTISTIFLLYSGEMIASVFWITAGTFFISSIAGFVFKIDLAKTGGIMFMLLAGWSLAWIFSLIFASNSTFNWTLNFIGIALFVGLTAWDAAAIKQMAQKLDSHPARGGLIVLGALKLYLDFINLFLLILRASSRNG